ncbi:MAG: hypothetical protein FWH23_05860 [Bacteroidales bacterium]|nr:hypothetical protein [Bacteroidales bacterium]MCL2133005.1 hypothetical protein [Bacteroidales bacterium]
MKWIYAFLVKFSLCFIVGCTAMQIYQVGDSYYVMRSTPSTFTKLLQNSKNVWLKDSTDWLQKEIPALYIDPFSVEPDTEEIKVIVLNQVFQHDWARLASLSSIEPPLLYKCLIDKSGEIIEVIFDLDPDSQLRFEELRRVEIALKQSIQFSNFYFVDENNTLENIPAKYLSYTDYIEFRKVESIDMSKD